MKPNHCLDCNDDNLILTERQGRPITTPFAVECFVCSRVGPLAKTEDEAIAKWNEENQ